MSQPSAPLTPEQRIRELEEQLELVTQKAEFLDAVVNVLKNDYGISVIKKRPGKSSRKNRPQNNHYPGLSVPGTQPTSLVSAQYTA